MFFFPIWQNIKKRCYDIKNPAYKNYGGRGVIMCEEWKNDYQKFLDWSLANGWEQGLQLDKDIKGTGFLYSPENCIWVTPQKNANNRRNNVKYPYKEQMLTAPEIARIVDLPIYIIAVRLRKGFSVDDAVNLKYRYNVAKK